MKAGYIHSPGGPPQPHQRSCMSLCRRTASKYGRTRVETASLFRRPAPPITPVPMPEQRHIVSAMPCRAYRDRQWPTGRGGDSDCNNSDCNGRRRRRLQDVTDLPPGRHASANCPHGPWRRFTKKLDAAPPPLHSAASWEWEMQPTYHRPGERKLVPPVASAPTLLCFSSLPQPPSLPASAPSSIAVGRRASMTAGSGGLDVERPVVLVDLDANRRARGAQEISQLGTLVRRLW